MAVRVDAIEIARTVDGQTDAASHLRRIGAGTTLCGIRIAPAEANGPERVWYPVSDDEARRFMGCDTCTARSSAFRVVSRPAASIRPESAMAEGIEDIGNVAGLYGAISGALSGYMADKAIVPHSVMVDVYRLLWVIADLTEGNGLNGGYSALDAVRALRQIDRHAAAARYDLLPYVPESVKLEKVRSNETAPETARTSENT